jgi:hypothetical protein
VVSNRFLRQVFFSRATEIGVQFDCAKFDRQVSVGFRGRFLKNRIEA